MTIRYVCGADIEFKDGQKYACQPMAICESPLDAAKANEGLHSSFGYAIYKVDADVQCEVTLTSGMAAGGRRSGLKVIEHVGQSYNILEESKNPNPTAPGGNQLPAGKTLAPQKQHRKETAMNAKFSRLWNVTGKTWLDAFVPGPWAVDNSLGKNWGLVDTESGNTKKIGPAKMHGINYFDRAMEEANRRNLALLRKIPLTDAVATRFMKENPDFVLGDEEGSLQDKARLVLDRMCDEIGYDYPCEFPEHRDALLARIANLKEYGAEIEFKGEQKSASTPRRMRR